MPERRPRTVRLGRGVGEEGESRERGGTVLFFPFLNFI